MVRGASDGGRSGGMRLAEPALRIAVPALVVAGIFIFHLPFDPAWLGWFSAWHDRVLREGAEPTQGEPAYEIEIAVEEIVFREFGGEFPANLLEGDAARFADIAVDGVEQQQQRAAAARGLFITGDFPSNDGLNGQFFAEFPRQCFFGRFADFDLATWKFPLQPVPVVRHSLADEKLSFPVEDSRDNDERTIHHGAG